MERQNNSFRDKSNKLERTPLLIITFLIAIYLLTNIYQSASMIGTTFQGFGIGSSLQYSPTTPNYWTGFQRFGEYDRITAIDGQPVNNIDQFKKIIGAKAPGVPVEYTF